MSLADASLKRCNLSSHWIALLSNQVKISLWKRKILVWSQLNCLQKVVVPTTPTQSSISSPKTMCDTDLLVNQITFWSPKKNCQTIKIRFSTRNVFHRTINKRQTPSTDLEQSSLRKPKAPQCQPSAGSLPPNPPSRHPRQNTDLRIQLNLHQRALKQTSTVITNAFTTSRRWKIGLRRATKSSSHRCWATWCRKTHRVRRNSKRLQTSFRRRPIRLSLTSRRQTDLDGFLTYGLGTLSLRRESQASTKLKGCQARSCQLYPDLHCSRQCCNHRLTVINMRKDNNTTIERRIKKSFSGVAAHCAWPRHSPSALPHENKAKQIVRTKAEINNNATKN